MTWPGSVRMAVMVLLAACSVDAPPDEESAAPDSTAVAAVDDGTFPDSLLIRAGACPFECCTYGSWVARAEMPVFSSERGTEVAFVLQPGDTIAAETGNVHVTGVQRVVIAREVSEYQGGGHVFSPGDTLVVLDYVGEGFFHAWHEGQVYQPETFWVDEAEFVPGGDVPAYSIGTHDTEWWVQVRSEARGEGWMRMGDDVPFGGADACGFE